MLSVEELRTRVESGSIDTVVVAFTDLYGRLMGKRYDDKLKMAFGKTPEDEYQKRLNQSLKPLES